MDVVVDHADVLHERVHARRADEAVPLRLQLLRERLRLRGRGGEVGEGPRCPLARDLVGLRERRRGSATRTSSRGRCRQSPGSCARLRMIEASCTSRSTSRAVIAATLATSKPRNAFRNASRFPNTIAQLSPTWNTPRVSASNMRGLVVGAGAPDLVVVAAEGGVAGAGPGAAWLPVVPDDHVAAHPALASRLSRRRGPRHRTIRRSHNRAQVAPAPRAS